MSDIEVMRERLLEQELELGKLRAEVRETYRELARLRDTELACVIEERNQLKVTLESIYNSKGWKLIRRIRHILPIR